jgi:hypothetical protein
MNSPALAPLLQPLYRQSTPGSHINEDGMGLHGRYAWVIDGATGMSNETMTEGASDAAWLAGRIGDRLQALLETVSNADAVLGDLEALIRGDYDGATAHLSDRLDDHAPGACLGLIGARPAGDGALVLEGWFLGDVVALVPSKGGIVRWTDERAKPFERKTLAALGGKGHEPGRIPEAVRRQILENRASFNRPEGYWVVSPSRPWAGQELRFEAQVGPGEPIVLATDGFMRLVDVFGVYSDETLHAALAGGRGDGLMRELRSLECNDPMAAAHPRVKTHDDASVLVIAAEPCG